ncbi:hypothetical protein [Salsipaludibacter albus]|uniref:hypothetical protein n=1 Tax=Salsipaludibacter albus TaxID=2849650 RepID=UPI001EE3C7D9|nr:hypothetical protein [Salsipaludibacter albus]MBY5161471.1 hypothetical protein [Salsipaludibacter albus]
MIGHELRCLAVGAALVAAVIGLWIGLRPDAPDPPAVPTSESPSTVAREALDTLQAPADLDSALAAAEAFAAALYTTHDLDALEQLTTDRLAATLLTPTRHTTGSTGRVTVEGTITRDLQPGRVLADVIVHRTTDNGVRLETVAVAVVLVDGRWLVDDAAF